MWQEKPRVSNRSAWRLLLAAFFAAIAVVVFVQRQAIADHISVWQYEPSKDISMMAERADMSDQGRFYFFASQPELLEADQFNKVCADHDPEGATLGCYRGGIIYIYNVEDQRLDGIREVTAAHEMLHAAYARLGSREKDKIHELIDKAYEQLGDEKLAARLELYDRIQPGTRYVELHAIMGTEHAEVPAELEEHYAEFFNDRLAVVDLYESYAAQFTARENRAAEIQEELEPLAESIESESARYSRDVQQLRGSIGDFNNRASHVESIEERNALIRERGSLLTRTAELESRRASIDQMIKRYNALVEEYNSIAIEVQDLHQSLDSLAPAPSV